MNRPRPDFLASAVFLIVVSIAATAADKPPKRVLVSVSSRTDGSYQRTKLPDGSFKPELYAISNGGMVAGTMRDSAQESMDVSMIAKAVAEHLAKQKYFLAPDAKTAELLLVVQWGRTVPFNDFNYSSQINAISGALAGMQNLSPASAVATTDAQVLANQERMIAVDALESAMMAMQMQNKERDDVNAANARLLGYIDDINDANDITRFAGRGDRYNDLVGEIEEARYYIIVSAYDFRRLVDLNETNLRWVTRISIRAQGNRFGQRVEEMIARASRYFGTDSGKVIREYEGTVEMGEPHVIGIVDDEPEDGASAVPPALEAPNTAVQPR